MAPKTIRVCVIGAGPSGLSFLYHANRFKESIAKNVKNPDNVALDVVCYEKHATCGGLWNMSWRVGKNFQVKHQVLFETNLMYQNVSK